MKLQSEGKTIAQKIDEITLYANTGELNFVVDDKDGCIAEIESILSKKYNVITKYDFDGVRLEFEDFWLSLRKSNTEPYLRLVLEANSRKILDEKLNEVMEVVNKYIVK